MQKKSVILVCCIGLACTLSISAAFAENKMCQDGGDNYCVNVDVVNNKNPDNIKQDLCFILQVNASDRFITGSVAMEQLPTMIFSIPNNNKSLGKPLSFKIIKAQIVPAGQCQASQSNVERVDQCEILEYAAIAGVSRSVFLIKNRHSTGFICRIEN